ncbi:MAG TPA: transglutaminaseTgpA domain-containing protein [Acidimicrobiales bacterium]
MTATAVPPRTPAGPGPGSRSGGAAGAPQGQAPAGRAATPAHQPAAELWLVLVTLAVVSGFSRIFSGWDFVGPLTVTAVVTHVALVLARRKGLSLWTTAILSVFGFALLMSWLFFLSTTRLLVPTLDTVTAARLALDTSWSAFQEVVAPTPSQPGFLLAACFGVFFAVFLADWAAFRLWAAVEALVPTMTLLVFTSLVGSSRGQVVPSALYALSAMFFVVRHRVADRERSTSWLGEQVDRGSTWLLRTGTVLAVVAVLVGTLVGTHLPGSGGDGLLNWHGKGAGPSSRITISPLVDIRSRLVDQSNTDLFTVTSPTRAYWRLTSLDTFDGSIWKSSGRYTSVDGRLPDPLPSGIADPGLPGEVEQTFRISALSALWLPAAYEPVSIDAPDTSVRYQRDSATLIVDTNVPTSDGQSYTVRSVLPTFTPDQLRSATTVVPESIARDDTALPGTLSGDVRQLARQITEGKTTAYDKALALQSFFRDSGGFVYDQDVPQGHGDDAIVDFLKVRRGYCEQFAGTFAAMARSAGLPARVAVGFTPGLQDPTNPDRYLVKGEHAHAWPEVWLGQYGWVPFEPTPGRGAPNAQSYTNVPEAQATPNARPTTTTVQGATTTTAADAGNLDAEALARQFGDLGTGGSGRVTRHQSPWPGRLAVIGLVLGFLALAYLIGVPTVLAGRRRSRRRAAAGDPSARVRVAWLESTEAVALAGTTRKPDETSREFAGRAGQRLPDEQAGITELAAANDAALFGSERVDDDAAESAERIRASVHGAVTHEVALPRRVLAWLDIRRVWRPHGGNRMGSTNRRR